jgi:predicted house-cleaning noncanonical NTP pyrophosphatase (MazG superfamily)
MNHNKLVRDRIPEIIRKEGKEAEVIVLNDEQYLVELKAKLIEEATEVSMCKKREEILAELADVREVMDALMQAYEINPMEVSTIQALKAIKRGKFEKKYYLKEVK